MSNQGVSGANDGYVTQSEPSAAHAEVESRKVPEEEIGQAQEGGVLSKANVGTTSKMTAIFASADCAS